MKKICYGFDNGLGICLLHGVYCTGYNEHGNKYECYHNNLKEYEEEEENIKIYLDIKGSKKK